MKFPFFYFFTCQYQSRLLLIPNQTSTATAPAKLNHSETSAPEPAHSASNAINTAHEKATINRLISIHFWHFLCMFPIIVTNNGLFDAI